MTCLEEAFVLPRREYQIAVAIGLGNQIERPGLKMGGWVEEEEEARILIGPALERIPETCKMIAYSTA